MNSITLVGAVKTVYTGGTTLYRREYRGFREDFNYLPTDDDLASGSICKFIDTGGYAEYFAGNKTWYLHTTSSGSSGSSGSDEDGVETATDGEVADMIDSIFGTM